MTSSHKHAGLTSATGAVIVVSTRAASGEREDASAPLFLKWFESQGITALPPVIVPDGPEVTSAIRSAIAQGARLVLTTGGTGITADDVTPEFTRVLLERELPGIPEAIRARGLASTATASLSRGVAGTIGTTLVINFPGSSGGIRDGLAVITSLWPHALDQLDGDHSHVG